MKFIMYGAGNIGRGFIGALFSEIGYEVVFVDINEGVIELINQKHEYTQEIIDFNKKHTNIIANVRAINAKDVNLLAKEMVNADLMATAVGARVLPQIAKNIAYGLEHRFKNNKRSFNILICENLINADLIFKKEIKKYISNNNLALFTEKIGIVETCIGRMVPVVSEKKS